MALAEEKDVGIRSSLAAGLCRIAQRMESADAAKVCGPVIDNMAAALVAKTGYSYYLSDGFAIVASRVSPADAARAAHVLADAMNSATDANVRRDLASSLSKLAGRLAPTEAAQICGRCVRVLQDALAREASAGVGDELASELEALAGRMEPAEASRICGQFVRDRGRIDSRDERRRPHSVGSHAGNSGKPSGPSRGRGEFADWPPRFSRMPASKRLPPSR